MPAIENNQVSLLVTTDKHDKKRERTENVIERRLAQHETKCHEHPGQVWRVKGKEAKERHARRRVSTRPDVDDRARERRAEEHDLRRNAFKELGRNVNAQIEQLRQFFFWRSVRRDAQRGRESKPSTGRRKRATGKQSRPCAAGTSSLQASDNDECWPRRCEPDGEQQRRHSDAHKEHVEEEVEAKVVVEEEVGQQSPDLHRAMGVRR